MECRVPDKGYYLFSSIVPDVFGWIEVDGEPLEVYGVTEKENKTIGYIEAKEGQQFVVRVADLRRVQPEADFTMQVFLDGTKANGVSIGRAAIQWDSPDIDSRWQHTFRGRPIGETTEQPFLFSKLQTTDSDELACTKEEVVKNLGTIQLRYSRIKNIKPFNQTFKPKHTEPEPMIHERAKKAQLSHQAAYGETVQVPEKGRSKFNYIDPKSSPLFQFEFRYRSRQLLQLEGYIPNSPAPTASPEPEQCQPPEPRVASTSSSNRSVSATRPSPAPQTEDAAERLARLEARFESLKRQEEMARLQMEIAALRGEVGESPTSSSTRKIKAEPSEDQREHKRVKQEIGEASLPQSSGSAKGKGKEKKKADVIVLSDSD
ncbi:hypothetical protein JCM5350_007886 [Sporobolomyces pararoseus]